MIGPGRAALHAPLLVGRGKGNTLGDLAAAVTWTTATAVAGVDGGGGGGGGVALDLRVLPIPYTLHSTFYTERRLTSTVRS